jgi:hypothetical protein
MTPILRTYTSVAAPNVRIKFMGASLSNLDIDVKFKLNIFVSTHGVPASASLQAGSSTGFN